ncbi:phosphate ABC transporter ATP-binding protein [Brevibacillus dissolubilis]|uniref:phosphate ABC transporter ATP-binding protein n=1 Tax=Brevibacillus dissolubilis TaxID=1844116 RepID=UPI001C3F176A|nr:ATP-binding cassette domain-containing protein [Brevibacillus dissolubilis]
MSKIRLEKASFQRKSGDSTASIFAEITLEIQKQEIVCLLGPSGSGKSTLLRCINRLGELSSGHVWIDDRSIFDLPPQELRRRVGMVLQTPSLFDLTVWENISYGLRLKGASPADQQKRARELIRLVGLDEQLLTREALSLSIGQQQRVSIARTLANDPEVLLLDEITSALDPQSARIIEDLILLIRDQLGKTIILVTHSMHTAKRVADRIALLMNGRLVEYVETERFFSHPEQEETKQFLAAFMAEEGAEWK